MTKFIGRLFNIGVSRETTRATARAAQVWLPSAELSFDERVELARDDSTYGIIENQQDADVITSKAEGTLSGIVNDDTVGYILNATFGTVVTTGPSDSAYTHTFNIAQSAQHQSLSLTVNEPNATGASSLIFPLLMIDSLDLDFEVGQYPMYSAAFVCNTSSSTTSTVAYTSPDNFKPQDGTVRFSTLYSNVASGTSYAVRKASISISKNIEDDNNIGSVTATDRLNKQVSVSGSVELMYTDREFITNLKSSTTRAMQLKLSNPDKTIGVSTNPSITIKIAKVQLTEVARKIDKDDLVTQTLNFEGFYSFTDSKMIDCVLVNDVTTYA